MRRKTKQNILNIFLFGCLIFSSSFLFVGLVEAGTTTSTGTTTVSGNYPDPGTGCVGCGSGGDTTAPAPVTDLTTTFTTSNSITLRWTAPGDDDNSGTATSYDLRYAVASITDANWGTATAVSGEPAPALAGTTQGMAVSGLSANTTYYFALKTSDEVPNISTLSNIASSSTLSAVGPDITAPEISNIHAVNVTDIGAHITWTTNEAATSTVVYGLTTGYELTPVSNSNFVSSHDIELIGLQPETTYHFKVKSADASFNEAVSADQTFVTIAGQRDTIAPVISDINVTAQVISATITWQTNELADSQISYGKTIQRGSLQSNAVKVKDHSLTVSPLQAATKYYFVIISTDASGNQGSSDLQEFTTNSDTTPPANVGSLNAVAGDKKVTLSWQNPTDSDLAGVMIRRSTTGFPQTPAEGTLINHSGTSKVDTGLTNGVLYYYSVFAYDTSNNFSSGAIVSASPFSGEEPPPIQPPSGPGGPEEIILKLSDFSFSVAKGKITVPAEATMNFLPGSDLGIIIPVDKLPLSARSVTLSLDNNSYLLKFDPAKNGWVTEVTVPSVPGDYSSNLFIIFENNKTSTVSWKAEVLPFGRIYAKKDGKLVSIEGAKISLLTSPTLWPAEGYGQQNPQFTNANGEFGYLVPVGKYILRVEKEGYQTQETGYFDSVGVVVNKAIEFLVVPPKLQDILNPEAPLLENVANVTKNLGEKTVFVSKIAQKEVSKFVADPAVKEVTRDVVAPVVAGAAAVGATTAVGASQLLMYLRFLFTQPILVLFRRKRKGWGVVYNALTKLPLDLVTVRLIDATTGRVIQSKVTDKEGRYAFLPLPGKYLIDIKQNNFKFPTNFLNLLKEDGTFLDLYHGEAIEAKDKGAILTPNIPLDPLGEEKPIGKILWQLTLRRLQHTLSIISLVLALVFILISPGVLTGILLAVQIIFYILFLRLAYPRRPKSWGIVYNEKNKNPLARAVVRIFDTEYNKLLETQVTDHKGRYSFLVGRNKYYMMYEKLGFEKKQSDPVDLQNNTETSASVGVDVGLNPQQKNITSNIPQ